MDFARERAPHFELIKRDAAPAVATVRATTESAFKIACVGERYVSGTAHRATKAMIRLSTLSVSQI